jgi:hypothetical protein
MSSTARVQQELKQKNLSLDNELIRSELQEILGSTLSQLQKQHDLILQYLFEAKEAPQIQAESKAASATHPPLLPLVSTSPAAPIIVHSQMGKTPLANSPNVNPIIINIYTQLAELENLHNTLLDKMEDDKFILSPEEFKVAWDNSEFMHPTYQASLLKELNDIYKLIITHFDALIIHQIPTIYDFTTRGGLLNLAINYLNLCVILKLYKKSSWNKTLSQILDYFLLSIKIFFFQHNLDINKLSINSIILEIQHVDLITHFNNDFRPILHQLYSFMCLMDAKNGHEAFINILKSIRGGKPLHNYQFTFETLHPELRKLYTENMAFFGRLLYDINVVLFDCCQIYTKANQHNEVTLCFILMNLTFKFYFLVGVEHYGLEWKKPLPGGYQSTISRPLLINTTNKKDLSKKIINHSVPAHDSLLNLLYGLKNGPQKDVLIKYWSIYREKVSRNLTIRYKNNTLKPILPAHKRERQLSPALRRVKSETRRVSIPHYLSIYQRQHECEKQKDKLKAKKIRSML